MVLLFLFAFFVFLFSFPDHSDDAGSAAKEGTKYSGGTDDGVIGAPHEITAHQVTAGDAFVTGGYKEHTEHGTDDRKQFQ